MILYLTNVHLIRNLVKNITRFSNFLILPLCGTWSNFTHLQEHSNLWYKKCIKQVSSKYLNAYLSYPVSEQAKGQRVMYKSLRLDIPLDIGYIRSRLSGVITFNHWLQIVQSCMKRFWLNFVEIVESWPSVSSKVQQQHLY